MEALIVLVALVSLALLAIRFGVDSRPGIRSDEHRLALSGVEWDAALRPDEPAAVVAGDPPVRWLTVACGPGMLSGGGSAPFPTLRMLDRARELASATFVTDPDAAVLEVRARQLIDQHWSERVWLTGLVDQARFDRVCDALERERQALRQIEVVVIPEQPASIAS